MSNAPKLRVLDLFSGIGGFSLGLERTGGFETVAFCEIDPYCQAVLWKHWPDVPIFEDVRELTTDDLGPIDVICGGFPCQPFSTASRGRRVAVDLWPDMFAVVATIRPQFVVAENVAENPIKQAERDLCGLGYNVTIRRISGADAGADHTRNRWWAVAHPHNESEFLRRINAKVAELPSVCRGLWGAENYARAVRVSDGIPYRMERFKCLGNAVVPQVVEIIGRTILEARRKT